MKTLTLDWNCIIAVEQEEPAAEAVLALARLHQEGRADVALLATSASENLRDGTFPGSYQQFEKRVKMEALECLPVLNALGVYALSFWERSYWVNKERYGYLHNAIWETLFSQISRKV